MDIINKLTNMQMQSYAKGSIDTIDSLLETVEVIPEHIFTKSLLMTLIKISRAKPQADFERYQNAKDVECP